MDIEHQLTFGPLLDENGNLAEAGYAFSLVKEYDRKKIKGLVSRIKEWDYYYIGNRDYGVALTVADNSYMWLVSVTFFDFINKKEITSSPMGFFSFGKLNMPSTSNTGDVLFQKKNFSFIFRHENNGRHLMVSMNKFGKEKVKFATDLFLTETNKDSMVIATPFEKAKHFYYNQKINLLKAKGFVKVGNQTYDFNDSYGVLDWGRGIWTYKNTWYWSSMNSIYNGERIGWNLGYGFGDTSKASENMFFYRDRAYKLKDVKFNIPEKNEKFDYLSPWSITSLSGDINVIFKPVLDRHSDSNVLLIRSYQHQVFGLFTGNIKINGEEVHFENVPGFAERVYNRW
ncbi:MAG: DUF2804 domain-containing protein [Bacilli bacterium]|nr:DUF2804 domain-containing protein [Bacilli bacterium]